MAASRRCGDGSTPSLKQRSSWPLPEGVLLCILGFLDTNTLLSTAALVCKGWRELTLSAQLLSTVEAQLPGAEEALLSRLRLFRAWLQRRAGQHVRRLRIVMPDYGVPHGAQGPDEEAAQLLLRIDSKLVAVCQDLGRHHQLEDLSVSLRFDGMFSSLPEGWATALGPTLRRLRLDVEQGFVVVEEGALQAFSALEDLELGRTVVFLEADQALPLSLTRLRLGGYGDDLVHMVFTPQLSALTLLRNLCLESADFPADGFAPLGQLPALRRLHLAHCKHLPDSLTALTQLTALYLQRTPREGTAVTALQQVDAALAFLTQLRHLALGPAHHPQPLRAALASMTSLHTLAWVPQSGGAAPLAAELPLLPEGPYLRSLRGLAAPAVAVLGSLPVLGGATQLHTLGLFGFSQPQTTEQQQLMRWVVAQPAVRQLVLDLGGDHLCAASLCAVTDALRSAPRLHLELKEAALRDVAWPASRAPAGFPPWRLPDP